MLHGTQRGAYIAYSVPVVGSELIFEHLHYLVHPGKRSGYFTCISRPYIICDRDIPFDTGKCICYQFIFSYSNGNKVGNLDITEG